MCVQHFWIKRLSDAERRLRQWALLRGLRTLGRPTGGPTGGSTGGSTGGTTGDMIHGHSMYETDSYDSYDHDGKPVQ